MGKSKFTVISETQSLFLYFINYCIVFHRNNCKPTSGPPSIIQGNCLVGIRELKKHRGTPIIQTVTSGNNYFPGAEGTKEKIGVIRSQRFGELLQCWGLNL